MAVATYRKKDYPEILKISEDRDTMDPTWEVWRESKESTVKMLHDMGVVTVEVLIRPAELVRYCREHRMVVNGQARAALAREKGDAGQ
jgi:hypothetical protein